MPEGQRGCRQTRIQPLPNPPLKRGGSSADIAQGNERTKTTSFIRNIKMSKKYLLTQDGLQKLNDELKELIAKKRPDVIERIREAASHGDLSENADYAQAREEQSFIEGRISEIEDMVKNAEIISTGNGHHNTVGIGSTVVVKANAQERKYTIVGSNEANPKEGKISNESTVGKALLGRKTGEKLKVVTPAGEMDYEIVSIE